MTYEDLFFASFAVGAGLCFSKEFFKLLLEWTDTSWRDCNKVRHVLSGILLFALLVYLFHILSSRQLF